MTLEERVAVTTAFALKLLEKQPERYDPKRLVLAQALALNPEHFAESVAKYYTTIWDCNCPDHSIRRITCKHMLAVMLEGCIFA